MGAILVSAAFAIAAFYLGQWQWGRYEAKHARAEQINSHYQAPPVGVSDLTPALTSEPLSRSEEWTRITLEGTYAAAPPLLVRNRPYEGTYGYEVLAVLRSPALSAPLLVDRGWVPNSDTAAQLPEVPATPTQPLRVTGWLKVGERSLDRNLPAGQLASINLAEAGQQSGADLAGAYLILEVERDADGDAPPRATPLEAPDTGEGPHQAYALQWWGSMPVGFVLVFFGIRRELEEGRPKELARAPRPKKVRIWDEEDA